MISPGGFGAATAMALILVLAARTDGLAENKTLEGNNSRANTFPRSSMKTFRPGGVAAAPAMGTNHNVAPSPSAPAHHMDEHDRDQETGHDHDHGAATVVIVAPGIYYVPPPSPADDPVAYCVWAYSSYDPHSGTYIGDDGNPHPCP